MWSFLVLTALANPKKDLAAAQKAADANDTETALRLVDGALMRGLKPKDSLEAHKLRIKMIASHPDSEAQLELLPKAHASYAALGDIAPEGLWLFRLTEETKIILGLTDAAVKQAENGVPKYCAEIIPHRDSSSPVEILQGAMQCAEAMEDASAASGIARDLLNASKAQKNNRPMWILPLVTSAHLVVNNDPKAMLARLDDADAELEAIKGRVEAEKEQLGTGYDMRMQEADGVHLTSVSKRLNVTTKIPDSEADQKPLLEEFLRLQPDNTTAYIQLGQVLLNLGEEDAGIATLAKAAALDPKELNAPYATGVYWTNKAVPLVNELNGLERRDPRIKELDGEIDALYEKAKTALLAAHAIDATHDGTVSALKQICESLDDKACLKKVGGP